MTFAPTAPVDEVAHARQAEERRRALRLLLAQPLACDSTADPDGFVEVRRHAPWLREWFDRNMGYRLVVEAELARLSKRPAPGARSRPLLTRSRTPFDPRRYALLCLVLAALGRMELQTVLSELAQQVRLLAASEEEVDDLDLDRYAERLAFVDAVRWLVDLGVLSLTDGDEGRFLDGSGGDALYDIHARRLARLFATATPPSAAETPDDLLVESYADTGDGSARRIRHRLMRRLVEEPVLHLDDLDEDERAYLATQRPFLVRQVEEATGLVVEVRREGLAAIDPEGVLSDVSFPGTGTVAHAALLLAERLGERGRDASGAPTTVPRAELESWVAESIDRFRSLWSRQFTEDAAGAARLLDAALERLHLVGLVELRTEGVEPRPAVARYRAEEPPARRGHSVAEEDR